jgi:hypothetical protein
VSDKKSLKKSEAHKNTSRKHQDSLLDLLMFVNYLSKKEMIVFMELFNITLGKSINDIENGKAIDPHVTVSMSHFKKKLGVSDFPIKSLNKKIRIHFQDHIQIERQSYKYKKLKGLQSNNKYIFAEETFLGLYLLKYNGFLCKKTCVHKSIAEVSENEEVTTTYLHWLEQKHSRWKGKNIPAINYIIKLIKKKIVPHSSVKKVPLPKKDNKYNNILPENKKFDLSEPQVEFLLNNYNLKVVKSAYEDANWYSGKGNKINRPFSFLVSRAKNNKSYYNSLR